jgi:hypothetical protein
MFRIARRAPITSALVILKDVVLRGGDFIDLFPQITARPSALS